MISQSRCPKLDPDIHKRKAAGNNGEETEEMGSASNGIEHIGIVGAGLIGTMVGLVSFIVALALGPETRGKELSADLVVAG